MDSKLADQASAFSRFVAERLGDRLLTLEESLAAYRAYQSDLERFRRDVAPAIAELDTTGGSELDIDAIIARGRAMLADEGMVD